MGTYSAIFSWDSLRSLSVVTCHTNDMSFVPASGGLFVLGGWTDLCLHLALKTRLILHQYGEPEGLQQTAVSSGAAERSGGRRAELGPKHVPSV